MVTTKHKKTIVATLLEERFVLEITKLLEMYFREKTREQKLRVIKF